MEPRDKRVYLFPPIATANQRKRLRLDREEFLIVTSGWLIASPGQARLHALPQVSHYRRLSFNVSSSSNDDNPADFTGTETV